MCFATMVFYHDMLKLIYILYASSILVHFSIFYDLSFCTASIIGLMGKVLKSKPAKFFNLKDFQITFPKVFANNLLVRCDCKGVSAMTFFFIFQNGTFALVIEKYTCMHIFMTECVWMYVYVDIVASDHFICTTTQFDCWCKGWSGASLFPWHFDPFLIIHSYHLARLHHPFCCVLPTG